MADRETLDLTKLDGPNYALWKFGVTFVLEAKELIGCIDGTEDEPDKVTKLADWKKWKKATSQTSVILLSSVEKALHSNLINCTSPKQIWDKLKDLYGDSNEDAKQSAWEQFYAFRIKDGESIALQIEQLKCICKKLADANDKPSDAAVESKLLSSLPPKFSPFRMAWECTPKAERKKDALIARLLREDKRLAGAEEASSLALQIQALELKKNGQGKPYRKDTREKRKIEGLKKRTKCAYRKEKGHWVRECPKRAENEKSGGVQHTVSAFISDVTAFYLNTTEDDENLWLADSGASMHMTF